MSRRLSAFVIVLAVLAVAALSGCTRMVRVETGELVTCTYGEVVSNTIKVVEVPADKAGAYKVVTKTVTCALHKHLEDLYAQAQASILASDLAGAKAKLAEIVASDARFRLAQAQLDAINAGKTPAADSGASGSGPSTGATGTTGTDVTGKLPVGPVAGLSGYLPDALPGYTSEAIIADVFTLSRQYTPGAGGPTDSLVIVVEQYKNATAAMNEIKYSVVPVYSSDVSTVQIAGLPVRFGTDGKRFATLAWNEQGVLVVIEASSASRKPADLKSHLVGLASQIVK